MDLLNYGPITFLQWAALCILFLVTVVLATRQPPQGPTGSPA